jgi:hypothetical protein
MEAIAFAVVLLAFFALVASIAGVESRDGFERWDARSAGARD